MLYDIDAILLNVSTVIFKFTQFDYTPPPGGFVNGDETEWNATVWNDSFIPKPQWSEIVYYGGQDYGAWARLQKTVTDTYYGLQASVATLQSTVAGLTAPTQSAVSRTLNTSFRPSTTKASDVSYSVEIGTSLSLTGGAVGTAYLEISADNASWTEIARVSNGNTGTLTIGLALNQNMVFELSGFVPAAYYVRIRTQNNTGTPTFTYRSGQEVIK